MMSLVKLIWCVKWRFRRNLKGTGLQQVPKRSSGAGNFLKGSKWIQCYLSPKNTLKSRWLVFRVLKASIPQSLGRGLSAGSKTRRKEIQSVRGAAGRGLRPAGIPGMRGGWTAGLPREP